MKGNSRRIVALTSLALVGTFSVAACGDDGGTGGEGASGGSTSSSTTGASTSGQGGGTTSSTTGLPVVCDPLELMGGQSIDASCGLFVDPTAAGGGDGSQSNPFNSIAQALEQAKLQTPSQKVFVCAGTEPVNEAVVLDEDETLIGGVTCDTWQASTTKTEWTENSAAVPLTLDNGNAIYVQGFRIVAQNNLGFDPMTLHGHNSIAVIANGSAATFRDVEMVAGQAGNGGDGVDQTGQAPGWQDDPAAFDGHPGGGCAMSGGSQKGFLCPDGTQSIGGFGGTGAVLTGAPGGDGYPDHGPFGKGGYGQPAQGGWSCVSNQGHGSAGQGEVNGIAGDGSTASAGSISSTGYVGGAGSPGGNGQPGEGGGGGGGFKGNGSNGCAVGYPGPSGGGGGVGGCGGLGGGGGGAGGASIALLSISSVLTLTDVYLTSGSGGAGGSGGNGQYPGAGGSGGEGGGGACDGGAGGFGGWGGAGAGGSGGPSIGVAYVGATPDISLANITIASSASLGGAAGVGGQGGNTPGNSGEPGLLELAYEF
jgi:hypothetical protein